VTSEIHAKQATLLKHKNNLPHSTPHHNCTTNQSLKYKLQRFHNNKRRCTWSKHITVV